MNLIRKILIFKLIFKIKLLKNNEELLMIIDKKFKRNSKFKD
jgi:hypothetical protein